MTLRFIWSGSSVETVRPISWLLPKATCSHKLSLHAHNSEVKFCFLINISCQWMHFDQVLFVCFHLYLFLLFAICLIFCFFLFSVVIFLWFILFFFVLVLFCATKIGYLITLNRSCSICNSHQSNILSNNHIRCNVLP